VLGFPLSSRGQTGGPAAKRSEWYVSNTAGMVLERSMSRFAALRLPYCLTIEELDARALPVILAPYYRQSWIVERRILYKDGEESRVQWILRDGGGLSRLIAVLNLPGPGAAEEAPGGAPAESAGRGPGGFIELYGANGLIELERRLFGAGKETLVEYHYRRIPSETRDFLIRTETRGKSKDGEGNERQEALYTDYYRYTRNYSLRTIERLFHQAAGTGVTGTAVETGAADTGEDAPAVDGGLSQAVLRFPRRSLDLNDDISFVSPGIVYGSKFLEDVQAGPPARIVYETDERGRILGETRRGEDGEIIAELRNEWSGNRLSRVIYTSGQDKMITEYKYNSAGDRITERNYRNGVLERVVHISGDREEEELYMDGELVLRTLWEGGRRIGEERVRRAGPPVPATRGRSSP
jgi:hypothetical protein